MSYDTQQIDAMRAKIGELDRENIGLHKLVDEAATEIVRQSQEIERLKSAIASAEKKI